MQLIYERCCGIDVHKEIIGVCFCGQEEGKKRIWHYDRRHLKANGMAEKRRLSICCYGEYRSVLETDIQYT